MWRFATRIRTKHHTIRQGSTYLSRMTLAYARRKQRLAGHLVLLGRYDSWSGRPLQTRRFALRHIQMAALASFIAISAMAPALAATDTNDDKVIQQIEDFRNQYHKAEKAKNITFLQQLFTDEFFAVNSYGQVLDKPHYLERIKDPEQKFTEINPTDVQVHLYGNRTVAVWTEHVTTSGVDHGRPFGRELRIVRILAKQQGKWQVVFSQGTVLPASSK
jgi:hypothetical protein